MELFEIGKQCARPDCKQLDYLPFHCSLCNHSYCVEHKSFKDHVGCTPPASASPSTCHKCSQPVNGTSPYHSTVENEAVIDRHISAGCLPPQREAKARKAGKKCAFGGCKRDFVVGCF
ncbi:hypothetical protein HDU98_006740 [Podochytrium sp. JEL0797]|nr:hypothetical protein HDU98_006740 [Podochytrium sp. JEL0797]